MNLEVMPYLGSHCKLTFFLFRQFEEAATVCKIMIAHGSRYGRGNQPIEAIAHHSFTSTASLLVCLTEFN